PFPPRRSSDLSQHDAQRDHGLPSSLHLSHVAHIYFIISPETVAFSPQLPQPRGKVVHVQIDGAAGADAATLSCAHAAIGRAPGVEIEIRYLLIGLPGWRLHFITEPQIYRQPRRSFPGVVEIESVVVIAEVRIRVGVESDSGGLPQQQIGHRRAGQPDARAGQQAGKNVEAARKRCSRSRLAGELTHPARVASEAYAV